VRPELRGYIGDVPSYRESFAPGDEVLEHMLPDGASRLVFNLGEAPAVGAAPAARMEAVGASCAPVVVRLRGEVHGLSLTLRVGAARRASGRADGGDGPARGAVGKQPASRRWRGSRSRATTIAALLSGRSCSCAASPSRTCRRAGQRGPRRRARARSGRRHGVRQRAQHARRAGDALCLDPTAVEAGGDAGQHRRDGGDSAREGGRGVAVRCDHTSDDEVRELFERVDRESQRLDVVVNNAWGGHETFGAYSRRRSGATARQLGFDAGSRRTITT
jgi:hypothetical protein